MKSNDYIHSHEGARKHLRRAMVLASEVVVTCYNGLGFVAPASLRRSGKATFTFRLKRHDGGVPPDLQISDDGIGCSLCFSGRLEKVWIPWDAVEKLKYKASSVATTAIEAEFP